MDRKTVIGLVVIGAMLVGWWIWSMPSKEEIEKRKAEKQHYKDSVELVQREEFIKDSLEKVKKLPKPDTLDNIVKDSTIAALPDSLKAIRLDSIQKAALAAEYGPFSAHAGKPGGSIRLENEKFVLEIARKGGYIRSAKLKEYKSFHSYMAGSPDTLDLMIPEYSRYSMIISAGGGKVFRTDSLTFTAVDAPVKVAGSDSAVFRLRAYANGDSNAYLEYAYILKGDDFMLGFDIRFHQLNKIIDPQQGAFDFTWQLASPHQERDISGERSRSSIHYKRFGGSENSFGSGGNGKKEKMKDLKWVSFKQQFFSTIIIADNKFPIEENAAQCAVIKEDTTVAVAFIANLPIPYQYSNDETFGMRMYLGPNHFNTLKKYNLDLEDQINLGPFFLIRWINFLVIWVFNSFESLGMGYGLIILMLTLIIKLITSPVTYKTFVSSAKMRILKPEVDEIGAKYPDAADAIKKQQEVMKLYRKAGVSPLSGCIPALLQMPILFAMFSFFPAAIELRQQQFLWAVDLSSYDSILTLPFHIPFYGSHVSLFTLLMTATTLMYTMMSNTQLNTGGASAKQMKIMMIIMPILFLGVLNSYSAALSYYYFLSNLISIGLTLLIRKFFVNTEKLRLKIDENKKKPVKKSKFMQRLEDMQKAREEQMRKQQKKK